MPKFNVEVSYEVTEVYEIEAKDADVARMIVRVGNRAPSESRTTPTRIEMVTQISPRYVIEKAYAEDAYVVIDTHHRQTRIAKCVSKDFAEIMADAANVRHEEEDMR